MAARRGPDRIPNAPMREAFVASRMTSSELARELGWQSPSGKYDTTMVMRTLGLHNSRNVLNGKVYTSANRTMDIDNARLMCRALGVDFDELYDGLLPEQEAAGECKLCYSPMLEPDPEDMCGFCRWEIESFGFVGVSYTQIRAHETEAYLVFRLEE
jgi:hypothetical protein